MESASFAAEPASRHLMPPPHAATLFRPWEAPVVAFAESVSLPPDQIKYVSALLAGIPIGFLFRTITADPFALQV